MTPNDVYMASWHRVKAGHYRSDLLPDIALRIRRGINGWSAFYGDEHVTTQDTYKEAKVALWDQIMLSAQRRPSMLSHARMARKITVGGMTYSIHSRFKTRAEAERALREAQAKTRYFEQYDFYGPFFHAPSRMWIVAHQ